MQASTEVLILGGGPAGLAGAIALRQRDVECTVVEALAPGIDKACGEGLMPDALEALSGLGVTVTAADGYGFRGIRFINRRDRVEGLFPRGAGIGIRRPRLHALLVARAEAAGARLRWESRVKLLGRNSGLLNGEPMSFRWLVGADGHASSVRRWAGLDGATQENARYGFRRHYRVRPWSKYVETYWGPGGQFYVTPVAFDCVCVVYISRRTKVNVDTALESFPELAERLRGVEMVSQQRGAVSATKKLRRVVDGSVALLGDASGSADSITGEGLAMTFRQALALADAVAAGSLANYGREHRRIGELPHAMGQLMLTLDRWPALEARALRALAARPELFADLLSVHGGAKSRLGFVLTGGPRLGWSLLRPA